MGWHGKTSTASFGAATFVNILGWTCSLAVQSADGTGASATKSGREKTLGFIGGTATVTTLQGATQAATNGGSGTLILKRSASVTAYTGTAQCTNIENGQDKSGNATVTYSFKWTGAVANS
jgi:hypothetical protein